jgi:hypothetical protein
VTTTKIPESPKVQLEKVTDELRGVPHSEDESKAIDGDDEPSDIATIANDYWNSQVCDMHSQKILRMV